ncbi:MAG: hypothetical protein V4573_17840 [Pseudomonadota bacterium]
MKGKHIAAAVAIVLLAGCASTQFGMGQLVQTGNVGLDEVDAAKGLYRVTVMNTTDFDWDGGKREDREKAVAYLLGDKCTRTEVVSDVPLEMGTYTFTAKPRVKHSMTVRCVK